MSSYSDSSGNSSRKCRKEIKICFQDHPSDDSDESNDSQEPVNNLTSLVRETYLSYLIKMLSSNYKSTNKESSERIFSDRDIEQCAKRMEQKALRSSIAARWYQRAMLRMVAKIKQNTEMQKVHSELFVCSQLLSNKGTQTESLSSECSNEIKETKTNNPQTPLPSFTDNNGNGSVFSNHIVKSHAINSQPPQVKRLTNNMIHLNNSPEATSPQRHSVDNNVELLFHSYSESDESDQHDEIEKDFESVPISKTQPSEMAGGTNGTVMLSNTIPAQTLDERLAALKFDRLTEFAIGEFSPKNENNEIDLSDVLFQEYSDNENDEMPQKSSESPGLNSLDRLLAEIHGETGQEPTSEETVKKDRLKPKKRLVWRYEERYYKKRLMLKLQSLTTAKRLKLEHRLNELFVKGGNTCKKRPVNTCKKVPVKPEEDPLIQFKDRIKPWVVKHLMPHYKNGGKISTRDFFKHIARNVTDNLVATNLLPDEADVIAHINLVFDG